jgi:hypothetical protein
MLPANWLAAHSAVAALLLPPPTSTSWDLLIKMYLHSDVNDIKLNTQLKSLIVLMPKERAIS